MIEIKGVLCDYFETGSEGTYWIVQDEKHIDAKGMYSYEGMQILRNGDYLEIFYKEHEVWKGNLEFISTWEAKRRTYFKQYVKKYPSGMGEQLAFAGRWVHCLPLNVDLGLWYRIFMHDTHDFTGILKQNPKG